ncbi:hypothetical protein [Streptomyces sp. CA-106110]|uniref:ATP-dependent DNA ligase n=1 Tax=Streptomyces sp. CA-106110 TaxID=3240044 RepID=UPI003D8C7BDA
MGNLHLGSALLIVRAGSVKNSHHRRSQGTSSFSQASSTGIGRWIEAKFDGHRVAIWRLPDTVRLHTRAGRDVTSQWMDLAVPAMELRAATVLDGEAVVYVGGRVDFSAAQSRSASRPARARALAQLHPASYAAFDVLQHPDHGDARHLSYLQRRALLRELLEGLGPPLQAVPATNDRDVAAFW